MANTDAPQGFTPVRYRSGAPYSGAVRSYYVPSSDGTALFIGDPVIIAGSANTAAVNGHLPGTLPSLTRASVGGPVTGVVAGFETTDRNDTPYRAASTERVVFVADDPNLIFQIQDDGGGTVAATMIGLNADYIFTTSGSTYTGMSGCEVDAGTTTAPATTAGLPLKLLGIARIEGNELADYATWEVAFNDHTMANAVAGV